MHIEKQSFAQTKFHQFTYSFTIPSFGSPKIKPEIRQILSGRFAQFMTPAPYHILCSLLSASWGVSAEPIIAKPSSMASKKALVYAAMTKMRDIKWHYLEVDF